MIGVEQVLVSKRPDFACVADGLASSSSPNAQIGRISVT
jgi:hypothetical protein